MPINIAPQCCCGGPGILRVVDGIESPGFGGIHPHIYNLRIVNTRYDFVGSTPLRIPCWSALAYFFSGPCYPATGHLLGFDHKRQRLLYQPGHYYQAPGLPGNTIVPGAAAPDYFLADGEIRYVEMRSCLNGFHDTYQHLSGLDVWDIYQGSLPSSNPGDYSTLPAVNFAQISRNTPLTEYRIYGHTRWIDGATTYFKVWSVDYSGGDYIEHFTNSSAPSRSINVQDGEILTMGFNDDGDFKVFSDNSTIATSSAVNSPSVTESNYFPGPIGRVEDQRLVLLHPNSLTLNRLMIAEDGASWNQSPYSASAILFETEEDTDDDGEPDTVRGYYPISMSWDESKHSLAVVWLPGYEPEDFNPDLTTFRARGGYTTYISKALTAGNILGQDGVRVFDNYFVGYGFGWAPQSPKSLSVVLPGKLPPPLEIVGTYIVPPPPPPPPPPDCSGLEECESVEGLNCNFERFPAPYSAPDTEAGIGGTAYWSLNVLNGNFYLPYIDGTTYDFRLDFVAATENYADPGELIKYNVQDSDPTYKRERYVTHIIINVTCADGVVRINYINYYYQIFTGYVGSTWPTITAVDQLWQAANPDGESGGIAQPCISTFIRQHYQFEDFDTAQSPETDYSHEFIITATIGPSV